MTKEREAVLLDKEEKLNALEAGGVDNWDGYDFALEDYNKNKRIEVKLEGIIEEAIIMLCEGVYEPSERGAGYDVKDSNADDTVRYLKDEIKALING